MDAEAAKLIGAGIAAVGMAGAAIGVGNIFGSFLSGALRNPADDHTRKVFEPGIRHRTDRFLYRFRKPSK